MKARNDLGMPVVPPDSWKLSTSSQPGPCRASRAVASSSGMASISACMAAWAPASPRATIRCASVSSVASMPAAKATRSKLPKSACTK